jgi:trk system potassium uptake protein TrkA
MLELNVKQNCPAIDLPLKEMRKKFHEKFLILAIQRGEKVFIPNGESVIANGDKICVIASSEDVQSLLKSFGLISKPIRDVMIVGAGKTSLYLANLLKSGKNNVKIIEKANETCLLASEKLGEKVMVINGDGMSQEVLEEEGVNGAGAFVALTGEDEENILMSFYALKKNCDKVITKVNRNELLSISENLGLDTIVSPKKAVADVLVSYARALENSIGSKIETLYTVMNGEVEVAEFKVLPEFSLVGTAIKDLSIKQNVLIAGIIRNGESIIPGGLDEIKEGNGVIIVSSHESISDLEDIVK